MRVVAQRYSLSIEDALDVVKEPLSSPFLLQGFPYLLSFSHRFGIRSVDGFCTHCTTELS